MTSALLVIDVQRSFELDPLWHAASRPDIAEIVRPLVEAARAAGDLVVWVLHAEPGSGGAFDPASGLVVLQAPLAVAPGEAVVHKSSHNAFTTTDLALRLTLAGVRDVAVCGVRTEQCVETTVRVAADLGYDVRLIVDACSTTPREHWDAVPDRPAAEVLADPLTLSAAAIEERVAYALHGRFAALTTADAFIEAAGERAEERAGH